MHHIDATVLAVMDLVVSNNGVTVGSDLNSGQCIAVNVVVLD